MYNQVKLVFNSILHFWYTFLLSMVKKIKLKELENWFGFQFYNTTTTTTTTTNHFTLPDLREKQLIRQKTTQKSKNLTKQVK